MTDITKNLNDLRSDIPASVKIIAVSKTKPVDAIQTAYNAGHRFFGENRVKELIMKKDQLPPDIQWHMIGHLQTNKVRLIVPFISLIHSVDTYKLLEVIDSESLRAGKITDCLLQVHIAKEESKTGFNIEELRELLSSSDFDNLKNVRIRGLMGMATFTSDMQLVRSEFRDLNNAFLMFKNNYFNNNADFNEISMGMSGDYLIAIEEGSTMIRVGSLIFGDRN